MQIRRVAPQEREVIRRIVEIHMETFEGFFLTFLGRGFLRQMYGAYCAHEASGLLAAFDDRGEVVGFLAWSSQLSALYRQMIRTRLIPFAWYSLGALVRNPAVFMRLARAFLKPGEARRQEAYVELASIGVAPEAKRQGVGSALIEALKQRVDFGRYAYITLETDAKDNDAANCFYRHNGFALARSYTTHEGRAMNEYRYRSDA